MLNIEKKQTTITKTIRMDNEIENFPRRQRLDKCVPAELAIYKAMEEVEKIGSDVKLTDAIIKLDEARNLVADFIDNIEDKEIRYYKCIECEGLYSVNKHTPKEFIDTLKIYHMERKLDIPCRGDLEEISEKEFIDLTFKE